MVSLLYFIPFVNAQKLIMPNAVEEAAVSQYVTLARGQDTQPIHAFLLHLVSCLSRACIFLKISPKVKYLLFLHGIPGHDNDRLIFI